MGGTSLVVQWIRIRLPIQRTQVQSLVHMPACAPQLLNLHLKREPCNKKNHCKETPTHCNQRKAALSNETQCKQKQEKAMGGEKYTMLILIKGAGVAILILDRLQSKENYQE